MLGDLLLVGAQAGLQRAVLHLVGGARTVPGDGPVLHRAPMHPHQQLRRRANNMSDSGLRLLPFFGLRCRALHPEAQKVHVRRGIHNPQRAINIERIDAGDAVEALRENALKDVARGDVLLGAQHGFEVCGLGRARGQLQRSQP
jgi:hypothetical protein